MTRKRGKLSTEDEAFIRDNIQTIEIEAIAIHLNRNVDTIRRYCYNNNLTYGGLTEFEQEDLVLKAKLEAKSYWPEIRKQLTEDEQKYFVRSWIETMKQLREDIYYTEELQLKQWITLEIMADRVLKEKKKGVEQIQRIEGLVAKEYAKKNKDVDTIATLESELASLRSSQNTYTGEHLSILTRSEKVQKEMKTARADRVKKVEDAASSFSEILKRLEDTEYRAKMGEEIAIAQMAAEKAKERLSEYHTYEDGKIDQPFLTVDTLKE